MLHHLVATMMQNGGAPAAAEATTPDVPVKLTSGSTASTASSWTTDSISPTAGGLLIAVYTTRDDTDVTHPASPTASGLSNIGAWSSLSTSRQQSVPNNRWLRQTTYWAQVGSSPGTGTLTFMPSAAVFAQGAAVFEIAEGFNTTTPVKQSKAASGEGGASLAVTLDAAPDADSLLFSGILHEGTVAGSFTVPTDFTQVDTFTASIARKYAYDQAGGAQANTWTGLDTAGGDVQIAHVLEIDAAAVPPLVAPEFLDGTTVTSTAATASTPSVSPDDDALLLVVMRTRGSAVIGHNTPTTTLAGVGAWTQIDTVGMVGATDSNRWHRETAWWAKVTGDPGAGTATVTTSGGNFFSARIEIYQVPSGYNPTAPIGQHGTASNEAGTTATVTLAAAPAASSCVFSALQQAGNSAGVSPSTDYTELVDTNAGSSLHCHSQYNLVSADDEVALTGLIDAKPHLLLAFEIKAAVT